MKLYDAIFTRRSCRNFAAEPLPQNFLAEMEGAIASFAPLYSDVPLAHRFASGTKGRFQVSAPHYLVISGWGKQGERENAGFLYEQLALWLDAQGIGCVWLGGSKDTSPNPDANGKDLIIIALGREQGEVHRTLDEFKRKPIAEITNAPDNTCIKAAHLAPSGMNLQPWFFEESGGEVLVYEENLKAPIALVYKNAALDMGIALCHYALACEESGKAFSFTRGGDAPQKKGYKFFGVLR